MVMRIGGLASGLDIENLISQLMAVERRPVYLLNQQQNTFEARLDAWGEIRSRLDAFQSALQDLQLESTFDAMKATVGNVELLTATATSTATAGSYHIEVLQLAAQKVYQLDFGATPVSDPEAALGRGNGELTITARDADDTGTVNKTITIDNATTSLQDIADEINGWTDVGLKATVAQVRSGEYELVIEEERTGAKFDFSVAQSAGAVFGGISVQQNALDARVKIDSVEYSRSSNTLTDVLAGVTLNLQQVGGPTDLTVAEDTDSAYNAIKQLVDTHNALAGAVSKHSRYDAAQEQRGALQGDVSLQNLIGHIRSDLSAVVSGVADEVNSLAMLGITLDYKTGHLTIDETQVREKLAEHGAEVQKLFQDAAEGLAVTTEAYVRAYTGSSGIIAGTEESIQAQVDRIQSRIDFFEQVILPQKEARLRREFTRAEQLLAQFQSQGAWLSSQLGES